MSIAVNESVDPHVTTLGREVATPEDVPSVAAVQVAARLLREAAAVVSVRAGDIPQGTQSSVVDSAWALIQEQVYGDAGVPEEHAAAVRCVKAALRNYCRPVGSSGRVVQYVLSQTDFHAAYACAVEGGKGRTFDVPAGTRTFAANAQQAAARTLLGVHDTVTKLGYAVSSITTTPTPGKSGAAHVQKRVQPALAGYISNRVLNMAPGPLLPLLERAANTYVYANGQPDQWYERLAQVNERRLPADYATRFLGYVSERPFVSSALSDAYLEAHDAASVLGGIVAAPVNADADPGMPVVGAGLVDKEARWQFQRKVASDIVAGVLARMDATPRDQLYLLRPGELLTEEWGRSLLVHPALGTVIGKPKYDVYKGGYQQVLVPGKVESVLLTVPRPDAGKVRLYYSQPGALRMVTHPAHEYLHAAAETFGTRVQYERGADGRLEVVVNTSDGRLPWSALGYSPYRGGAEALHVALEREARAYGYGMVLYGDDGMAYLSVHGRLYALGMDASRFDLSQPQGVREVVEAAFTAGLGTRRTGAAGLVHGCLQLALEGLYTTPRVALLAGEMAVTIKGGTASGARCLTEGNSVVAMCCYRFILDPLVGAVERSVGPEATDAEVCASITTHALALAALLRDDTGMDFGIEAISPIRGGAPEGCDVVGPPIHDVPFLGSLFHSARTSAGVPCVVAALQAERADRKIIFEHPKHEESEEHGAGAALAYAINTGFVCYERYLLAVRLFGEALAATRVPLRGTDLEHALGFAPGGHAVVANVWPRAAILRFHTGECAGLPALKAHDVYPPVVGLRVNGTQDYRGEQAPLVGSVPSVTPAPVEHTSVANVRTLLRDAGAAPPTVRTHRNDGGLIVGLATVHGRQVAQPVANLRMPGGEERQYDIAEVAAWARASERGLGLPPRYAAALALSGALQVLAEQASTISADKRWFSGSLLRGWAALVGKSCRFAGPSGKLGDEGYTGVYSLGKFPYRTVALELPGFLARLLRCEPAQLGAVAGVLLEDADRTLYGQVGDAAGAKVVVNGTSGASYGGIAWVDGARTDDPDTPPDQVEVVFAIPQVAVGVWEQFKRKYRGFTHTVRLPPRGLALASMPVEANHAAPLPKRAGLHKVPRAAAGAGGVKATKAERKHGRRARARPEVESDDPDTSEE